LKHSAIWRFVAASRDEMLVSFIRMAKTLPALVRKPVIEKRLAF
jgi:hypothetical protein